MNFMNGPEPISPDPARAPRIMLYSHDTFGLGHLRRSRALAAAITGAIPDASALILTGSPVAGALPLLIASTMCACRALPNWPMAAMRHKPLGWTSKKSPTFGLG